MHVKTSDVLFFSLLFQHHRKLTQTPDVLKNLGLSLLQDFR